MVDPALLKVRLFCAGCSTEGKALEGREKKRVSGGCGRGESKQTIDTAREREREKLARKVGDLN